MSSSRPPVCDYSGSDYQERFWERGGRAYEDRVEAVALSRLLPWGGERLLDVGAGAGRHAPRYQGFRQVVLLDYARSQLEQARMRLAQGDRFLYVVADVYNLPFAARSFDAATMIRVLHHLADPPAALRQIRAALSTGGVFVLEYANKRNLKAIARWLLGKQSWSPFDRSPVEFARLNFDFHPSAVRSWLKQAGFRLRRQRTVSHFRHPLLKRLIPLPVLVALDSALQASGAWFQLTPSVFVRAEAMREGGQNGHRSSSTTNPITNH
ncbi:MAG TPA: class I SAM-dependent methyltransferase [Anaerolineales bacterium]|nr:class I SAM-dependent methyltransferase [Anaerolineales bacterium]